MIALMMFAWALAIGAAVSGAVFLSYHDKAGWGWLVFLAFVLACTSFSYKSKGDDHG